MSWQAEEWINACRFGSRLTKAVMLQVAKKANVDGSLIRVKVGEGEAVCWAKHEYIADRAEVSVSTVQRVLTAMERVGVIRRQHRYRSAGTAGGRTSDLVWIRWDRRPVDLTAAPPPAPGAAVDNPPGPAGLPVNQQGVTGQPGGGLPVSLTGDVFKVDPQLTPQDHLEDVTHDRAREPAGEDRDRVGVAAAQDPPATPPDTIRVTRHTRRWARPEPARPPSSCWICGDPPDATDPDPPPACRRCVTGLRIAAAREQDLGRRRDRLKHAAAS
jgi:hypothetical protein